MWDLLLVRPYRCVCALACGMWPRGGTARMRGHPRMCLLPAGCEHPVAASPHVRIVRVAQERCTRHHVMGDHTSGCENRHGRPNRCGTHVAAAACSRQGRIQARAAHPCPIPSPGWSPMRHAVWVDGQINARTGTRAWQVKGVLFCFTCWAGALTSSLLRAGANWSTTAILTAVDTV